MLGVSEAIDGVLARIAHLFGWLFIALVIVICFDVVTRKVGFQLPIFGSTPLQELEWHIHGLLFLSWLGYCYIRNVHVRIDVFTANAGPRKQAILEVFGILLFAIALLPGRDLFRLRVLRGLLHAGRDFRCAERAAGFAGS